MGIYQVVFKCRNCGKQDSYDRSQASHYKGMGKYCSLKCRWEYYQKNPIVTPNYISGKSTDMNGYIVINSTKQREHRFVMEKILGRKLRRDEHVHHRNGMKSDNRPNNLEILTASDHHRHHYQEGIGLGNPKTLVKNSIRMKKYWNKWKLNHWSKLFNRCLICRKQDWPHQAKGKCTKCYVKIYANRNRKRTH